MASEGYADFTEETEVVFDKEKVEIVRPFFPPPSPVSPFELLTHATLFSSSAPRSIGRPLGCYLQYQR
jgi:hypothetical protein